MEKPILPISEMSQEEFDKFKGKYLDGRILGEEAIKEISKLFGVGDNSTGRICCDEHHAHSYRCNEYYAPETGVVDRLLIEVLRYKGLMEDVKKFQ